VTSLERAEDLVAKLEADGVRATTDPTVIDPPCILFNPPNLRYDVPCGYTAVWQAVALAPAARTADRGTWADLETLLAGVAGVADVHDATLVSYVANGTTYPAYLLTWEEAIA